MARESPHRREQQLRSIILTFLQTHVCATITITELLLATEDDEAVAQELQKWQSRQLGHLERARLQELVTTYAQHRDECKKIADILKLAVWHDRQDDARERIKSCQRLFDELVARSEEASVALYSLGSPALLNAATAEIAHRIQELNLLGPDRAILQIGCGIGRFEAILAPWVRAAHGLDVSPKMVEVANRRCAGLPNVRIQQGSGYDLAGFDDGAYALVYAVDSLPYVVEAGDEIVDAYLAEAVRVLQPTGSVLIYNYSYRGNTLQDDSDVCRLAMRFGFDIVQCGAAPFSRWNGREYLLRRASSPLSQAAP